MPSVILFLLGALTAFLVPNIFDWRQGQNELEITSMPVVQLAPEISSTLGDLKLQVSVQNNGIVNLENGIVAAKFFIIVPEKVVDDQRHICEVGNVLEIITQTTPIERGQSRTVNLGVYHDISLFRKIRAEAYENTTTDVAMRLRYSSHKRINGEEFDEVRVYYVSDFGYGGRRGKIASAQRCGCAYRYS